MEYKKVLEHIQLSGYGSFEELLKVFEDKEMLDTHLEFLLKRKQIKKVKYRSKDLKIGQLYYSPE